jgi:hypothetical protein
MRRPPRSRPPRRAAGDGGAVLVETAMVMPIVMLLLMAVFEYGVFYRDMLGASDAVENGAKYGAIQGPDLDVLLAADGSQLGTVSADFTALLNTRAGLAGVSPDMIDRIVVFKGGPPTSGTPMAQVPSVCKTSNVSVANTCNVYLQPQAFYEIEQGNLTYFTCPAVPAGQPPCGWNPQSRSDGPTLNTIDYLGVYLKLRRKPLTGMIPVGQTIEVAAVKRLEPGHLS